MAIEAVWLVVGFSFFFLGNSINQAGSKIHLLQIDGNKWKIDNDHKCKQKMLNFLMLKGPFTYN